MNDERLKSKFASTVPSLLLSLGNLESLTTSERNLAYLSDFRTVSSATPILFLEKITGTVLGGVGVITLIATSLICGSLLFHGPSVVIDFLIDLANW